MESALIKVLAFVFTIAAGFVMSHTGKLGNMPGTSLSKTAPTISLLNADVHTSFRTTAATWQGLRTLLLSSSTYHRSNHSAHDYRSLEPTFRKPFSTFFEN